VFVILSEANRIRHLDRHGPYLYFNSQLLQCTHHFIIEIRNRLWAQIKVFRRAIAAFNSEFVIDEVKHYLERPIAVGHCGRSETARRNIQRNVPPVIDQRGKLKTDLAYNLRPHVQCRQRVLPFGVF
jgi:hypothetical protein